MSDWSRLRGAVATRAAEQLLSSIDGASAVVIATEDGFDIAHAGKKSLEPARLAAMISSFSALGEAASTETGIGTPRCLVIESTEGRLVVRRMQVGAGGIVVVLLTTNKVLLGLVWHALAASEQELSRLLR